jgi:hypothetical protein
VYVVHTSTTLAVLKATAIAQGRGREEEEEEGGGGGGGRRGRKEEGFLKAKTMNEVDMETQFFYSLFFHFGALKSFFSFFFHFSALKSSSTMSNLLHTPTRWCMQ